MRAMRVFEGASCGGAIISSGIGDAVAVRRLEPHGPQDRPPRGSCARAAGVATYAIVKSDATSGGAPHTSAKTSGGAAAVS